MTIAFISKIYTVKTDQTVNKTMFTKLEKP